MSNIAAEKINKYLFENVVYIKIESVHYKVVLDYITHHRV